MKIRAQVLYLAEGLVTVLGNLQCERVWYFYSPSLGTVAFGGVEGWWMRWWGGSVEVGGGVEEYGGRVY